MKVLLVYFSATGNTAKIAEVVKKELNELSVDVDELDITSYSERLKKIDLEPYDALILGFPVHSNRAPRLVREWMQTLDGKGKKCSAFCTYGGFSLDPTNYTTKQILDKQNFVLVSYAEFLGAHTYNFGGWKAVGNRPDSSDFDVAKEYALKTYKRFTGEDQGKIVGFEEPILSEKELDEFEKFRFMLIKQLPTREGKECSMCMICEELCPTQAMDAEKGMADRDKCILCLRCIANCPDDILKINDLKASWQIKLQIEKETEEDVNSKQSKIFL